MSQNTIISQDQTDEVYSVPWQKHEVGSVLAFLDSLKEEFPPETLVSQRRQYMRDNDDILEQLQEVADEGQEGYYAGADNVWQHIGQDSHNKRYIRTETTGDDNAAE